MTRLRSFRPSRTLVFLLGLALGAFSPRVSPVIHVPRLAAVALVVVSYATLAVVLVVVVVLLGALLRKRSDPPSRGQA